MQPIGRGVAALSSVVLVVSALALAAPGPAVASPAISLTSMTPIPQVKGELTLAGSASDAGERTAAVEQYTSGQWQSIAPVEPADDGSFLVTVPAQTAGVTSYRATLSADGDQPAVSSPPAKVNVFPEADPGFDTMTIPTISGDQAVGTTLQAEPGSWTPKADYFTYRWNRDGKSTGQTGRTHLATTADLGGLVTVTVTGWRSGKPTFRDSRPTTRVVTGTFRTAPPEIVGRAAVGQPLEAVVSGWSPSPSEPTYQWLRDETPIDGATTNQYVLSPADVGTSVTVTVRASAPGMEPAEATSQPFLVPERAGRLQRTFGDVIAPESTEPWTTDDLTFKSSNAAPGWGTLRRTRWDKSGAFTASQKPKLAGTLISAMYDQKWTRTDTAEYPGTGPVLTNADVRFTVTARRFSIAYRGNEKSDAMVWVDSRPVAASPIRGLGSSSSSFPNWISITLPARRTVSVRFAGPLSFSGVDIPESENGTVTATAPTLTLGVLSDSYYVACSEQLCMSRNAAPTLATKTGFRVWNMSESGTGYVMPGGKGIPGYEPSPYGSAKRFAAVLDAPIDALLIGGSMNDGNKAVELQKPAVDALLTQLEEERPDLPVVLLGVEPLVKYRSSFWMSRGKTFTSNLKSMVGRHQNVVGFIDPFTSPWITGTGTTASPNGSGNSDRYVGSDGVHLSVAGTRYYQQRVVDELRQLPLPAASP